MTRGALAQHSPNSVNPNAVKNRTEVATKTGAKETRVRR
jgi:hypothetical protein